MARNTNPTGEKPKSAKSAPKPPKADASDAAKPTRAVNPRGWLAEAVLGVCQDFEAGKVDTGGKPLTPHRIAQEVARRGNLENPPSTGAVSAVFKRWQEFGFANFTAKPFSFKAFSAKGKEQGLDGIITARSERRKAERAKAKKAAEKAAAAA